MGKLEHDDMSIRPEKLIQVFFSKRPPVLSIGAAEGARSAWGNNDNNDCITITTIIILRSHQSNHPHADSPFLVTETCSCYLILLDNKAHIYLRAKHPFPRNEKLGVLQ